MWLTRSLVVAALCLGLAGAFDDPITAEWRKTMTEMAYPKTNPMMGSYLMNPFMFNLNAWGPVAAHNLATTGNFPNMGMHAGRPSAPQVGAAPAPAPAVTTEAKAEASKPEEAKKQDDAPNNSNLEWPNPLASFTLPSNPLSGMALPEMPSLTLPPMPTLPSFTAPSTSSNTDKLDTQNKVQTEAGTSTMMGSLLGSQAQLTATMQSQLDAMSQAGSQAMSSAHTLFVPPYSWMWRVALNTAALKYDNVGRVADVPELLNLITGYYAHSPDAIAAAERAKRDDDKYSLATLPQLFVESEPEEKKRAEKEAADITTGKVGGKAHAEKRKDDGSWETKIENTILGEGKQLQNAIVSEEKKLSELIYGSDPSAKTDDTPSSPPPPPSHHHHHEKPVAKQDEAEDMFPGSDGFSPKSNSLEEDATAFGDDPWGMGDYDFSKDDGVEAKKDSSKSSKKHGHKKESEGEAKEHNWWDTMVNDSGMSDGVDGGMLDDVKSAMDEKDKRAEEVKEPLKPTSTSFKQIPLADKDAAPTAETHHKEHHNHHKEKEEDKTAASGSSTAPAAQTMSSLFSSLMQHKTEKKPAPSVGIPGAMGTMMQLMSTMSGKKGASTKHDATSDMAEQVLSMAAPMAGVDPKMVHMAMPMVRMLV